MTEIRTQEPGTEAFGWADLREVAREEFWIVAKAFFAPVYGTLLVLSQLLKLTRQVDCQPLAPSETAAE
jgi:hypothetical protein